MMYNPIVRSTNNIRLYKSYLKSKNESANVTGGELATSCVPMSPKKKVKFRPGKTIITATNERAYPLLSDANLVVIESTLNEKHLLKLAGLNLEETDKVHIVKDRGGNIKSAFSLRLEDNNTVSQIRYIDVDSHGKHFRGGLARLATLPGQLSFESELVDIVRDDITDGLIKA